MREKRREIMRALNKRLQRTAEAVKGVKQALTMPESAKCRVCLSASLTLRTSTAARCREMSRRRIGVTLIPLRSSQRMGTLVRAMRPRSRSVMNSCPTRPNKRTGRPGSTPAAAIADPRKTCRAGSEPGGSSSGS